MGYGRLAGGAIPPVRALVIAPRLRLSSTRRVYRVSRTAHQYVRGRVRCAGVKM